MSVVSASLALGVTKGLGPGGNMSVRERSAPTPQISNVQ